MERFAQASAVPVFEAKCADCGRHMVSNRDRVMGDTHAEPGTFVCEPCAHARGRVGRNGAA